MPTVQAHFAARRSDLIVVERTDHPVYEGGRLVKTDAGKYHQFSDHRLRVEGQRSIDFLRDRAKAEDGPDIWEIDASDVPSSTTLLIELATAGVPRIREILAAEEAGPNRMEIVDTAKAVLDKVNVAERGPGQAPGKPRHEPPLPDTIG